MNKIINWIKSFFKKSIAPFLAEVFTDAKVKVIEALKDIAVNAVTELATADLSSADKRAEAVRRVKAYAISKGIEAKDSVINLTIELAVSKLKG